VNVVQLYDVVRMHGVEVEPGVFQDETVLRAVPMSAGLARAKNGVREDADETFYVIRSGGENLSDIAAYVYAGEAGGPVVEENT